MNSGFYMDIPHTPVRVSLAALLTLLALLYADFSVYTVCVLAAAFLHECGHLLALKLCGGHVYRLTVLPFGAVIRSDAAKLSFGAEALVAGAGVLVNAVSCLILAAVYSCTHRTEILFFCLCHAVLGAVNAVPVKGLDGGRVLAALLYAHLPEETAETWCDIASVTGFAFLCTVAVQLLYASDGNLSLWLFCVYLFVSVFAKKGDFD